jgi:DNA-binding response OmpR family regulator
MTSGAAGKTIIVMDDSPLVLEAVEMSLRSAGFAVHTAATLEELEERRASYKADLFVLDVEMPEAFGDDVGQLLREVRNVGVPILLFSNVDEHVLAKRARDAGLSGYVPKAAGLPALVSRVGALLTERVPANTE